MQDDLNTSNEMFLKEENEYLLAQLEKLKDKYNSLEKTHKTLEQAFNDLAFKLLQKEIKESIQKHHPVDFEDIWSVVVHRLKTSKDLKRDFDEIVRDVKKYNPSLFFNVSL